MNTIKYLENKLTKNKYKMLIKENFKLGEICNKDDGLLEVLNDLFDWRKSKKGYNFWYDVAHSEY